MNDDSLDKLFREKVREQESLYPPRWPAPDVLWRSLNDRRDYQQAKRRKVLWQVAAAILILMTVGYTFFHNGPRTPIERDQGPTTLSGKEKDAVEFIARYCAGKNISCSTPVMLELRGDLEQSFKKLEEIDDQLQLYGNDAELMRAKARIESHQARLIKTIVQTL